jgi:hypothetical protein
VVAEDSAETVVHQLWQKLGIDPATKCAVSPDPPRDPPGPIAVCIERSWPIYDEFVDRVAGIVGPDSIVVVDEDDPSALPPDCFGAIGLEMWLLQPACIGRGLPVHMFETSRSVELEDVDRSWPGYKFIGFRQDWRPLVDRAAEELVRP